MSHQIGSHQIGSHQIGPHQIGHHQAAGSAGSEGINKPRARPWPRLLLDIAVLVSFVAAWITHDQGAALHSLVSFGFTAAALLHARLRQPRWSRRRRLDHLTCLFVVAVAVTGFVDWLTAGEVSAGHGAVAIAATVIIGVHIWKHRRGLRRLVRRALMGSERPAEPSASS